VGLVVLCASFAGVARAQDLIGNWQGTLQMGNGIRVVFKISKSPDGSLKGQAYNIEQPNPPVAVTTSP
jgi:hypothetical protein